MEEKKTDLTPHKKKAKEVLTWEEQLARKRKRNKILFWTVLLLILAVIFVVRTFPDYAANYNYHKIKNNRGQLEENFNADLQNMLPDYLTFPDYPEVKLKENGVSVSGEFSWYRGGHDDFYYDVWSCICDVTLQFNDAFAKLSDRDKAKLLSKVKIQCNAAVGDYYSDFIESQNCLGKKDWNDSYPGLAVYDGLSISRLVSVKVKSNGSAYEPGYDYDAFYRNGQYIDLDPPKYTPSPSPSPKPKYSYTVKPSPSFFYDDDDDDWDDPYDVYDYDDPDDFYYDHEDDFFDYEDAEDYFYDHY